VRFWYSWNYVWRSPDSKTTLPSCR